MVIQAELESVAKQIESRNSPTDVFRSMVENAVQASGDGNGSKDLLDALRSDEGLANASSKIFPSLFS